MKLFELPFFNCDKADLINRTTEFLALLSNISEELIPDEKKSSFLQVISYFLIKAKDDYAKLFVHQSILAEKNYFIPETISAFFFSWGALSSTFFPGMFEFISTSDAAIHVFDSFAATIGDATGSVILGLNAKTEQHTRSFRAIFKPIKMLLVEYGLNMLKKKDYSKNFEHKFSMYYDRHTGKDFTLENEIIPIGKFQELKNLIALVKEARDLTIYLDGLILESKEFNEQYQEYKRNKEKLNKLIIKIKEDLEKVKLKEIISSATDVNSNINNDNSIHEDEIKVFSDIAERFPELKELDLNIDLTRFNSQDNNNQEKQKNEEEKLLEILKNLEIFLSKLKDPEEFYDSLFDKLRKTLHILQVETGFWPSSANTRSTEVFRAAYCSDKNSMDKKV